MTDVSPDKFGEIDVPYLEGNRKREQLNAPLIYFETFFEVFTFFKECGVIDNDLGIRDAELQDFVIHGFCRLDSSEGLLEVNIERPKFERLEQSCLHRQRLQNTVRNRATFVPMKRTWSW